MKILLKKVWLVGCIFLLGSCSEKSGEDESVNDADKQVTRDTDEVIKPIIIANNVAKDPKLRVFRVTAVIYDAPALPLGENYNSIEQLTSAVKLAELHNFSHSEETAEINEQSCVFVTEMILGEDLKVVDLEVDLLLRDMQMKFFSSFSLGSLGFYELSQSEDPNRMYVVVLTVEKVESELK